MSGFKSETGTSISLAGIELGDVMRKLQGNLGSTAPLSFEQKFTVLAAQVLPTAGYSLTHRKYFRRAVAVRAQRPALFQYPVVLA